MSVRIAGTTKMKRIAKKIENLGRLSRLLVAVLISLPLSIFPSTAQHTKAFSGTGLGTAESPYLITDCDELQSIDIDGQNYETEGKTYKLASDIDCTATSTWNSGQGFDPINDFGGIFDGDGHTINGLTINRPSTDNVGLFSYAAYEALITRVSLTNVNITGDSYVGGIAGEINGTLLDVHVSGSVSGSNDEYYQGVGGIAGRKGNTGSILDRVSFEGTVTNAGTSTGGIVGYAGNIGALTNSFVNASVNGQTHTGGLIGYMGSCCNVVSNTYAIGDVTGTTNVGGLIGRYQEVSSDDNRVENSFAAIAVSGSSNVGAVVGSINNIGSTPLTNLAFDQDIAGVSDCIGASDSGVVSCTARNTDGLSPEYLQDSANEPLASWDFTDVWNEEVGDYPSLSPVTDLSVPGAVTGISVDYPNLPNEAEFSFTGPVDSGSFPVSYYETEVRLADSDWNSVDGGSTSDASPMSVNNLSLGTDYVVRIRAVSIYGAGDWTEYNFSTSPAVNRDISTCEQLHDIDEDASFLDNITLTDDIDCSDIDNFSPLSFEDSSYAGIFDGQGHTISNITMEGDDTGDWGLFSHLGTGVVRDLTIEDGSIDVTNDAYDCGALAGEAYGTTITDVHVRNYDISCRSVVGGIVGNYDSEDGVNIELTNLSVTGGSMTVSDNRAGGLFGDVDVNDASTLLVEKIYSDTAVNSEGSAGGLFGEVDVENDEDDGDPDAVITLRDAYSKSIVTSTGDDVGGLIGYAEVYNDGYETVSKIVIENTYSSGSISGYSNVGGLIGELYDLEYEGEEVEITHSFVTSSISDEDSSNAHAVIGSEIDIDEGQLTLDGVYFDQTATGKDQALFEDDYAGSSAINTDGSEGDYFKNNVENPPLDTWDFDDIWLVNVDDYPTFIGQPSEDINIDMSSAEDGSLINFTAQGCDSLGEWQTSKESQLAKQDIGFDYPEGLVKFELLSCESGGDATIQFTVVTNLKAGEISVRKYSETLTTFTTLTDENSNVSIEEVTIDDQAALRVTYVLTDGGLLDQDGLVNGEIVDPVGVAQVALTAPNTGSGH